MPPLTLPEPAGWPAGRRRFTRLILGAAAFTVVGVALGVQTFWVGKPAEGIVAFLLFVPGVWAVAVLRHVASGRTSLRAGHDSTGTILRPDQVFTYLTLGLIAAYIPIGIAIVTLTLTGDLHLFASRRGQASTVGLMSLATGTAVSGLITAWRRGGVGYLKLTPSGIDIANIKTTETVGWDSVVAVDDHSESNKKTRKAIVLRLQDGTEKTIDGADFYVPNGVGLYWMVRHYWRNPGDRGELVDDRALERLTDKRFETK